MKHFINKAFLISQRKYVVMVRGENFLVQIDGKPQKCGFYTTRYVTASEPKAAFRVATSLIRQKLQNKVLNDPEDNPSMYMEQAKEINSFFWQKFRVMGFSWFIE